MKRNGGREKQYASKQMVGRQSRQDDPGKWTQEGNKGFNSASAKLNCLLQGAEDLSATELQFVSGLETKKPLENTCGKIFSAHFSIEREKKKRTK